MRSIEPAEKTREIKVPLEGQEAQSPGPLESLLIQKIQQLEKKPDRFEEFLRWIKDFWPVIAFIGGTIWWMSGLVTQKDHKADLAKQAERCKQLVLQADRRKAIELKYIYKRIDDLDGRGRRERFLRLYKESFPKISAPKPSNPPPPRR